MATQRGWSEADGTTSRSASRRGWSVTAVEVGEELAAVARRALAGAGDVEVVTSSFEDWPLPPEPFDALVCATAWHWLDPATRLDKAVSALRPGGTVAVVWTHHVTGGTEEFPTRAQACHEHWDPETTGDGPPAPASSLAPFTGELEDSPAVTDVESHPFTADLTYRAEAHLDLQRTYSTTIRLPAEQRAGLLGCLGQLIDAEFAGQVTKRYLFELVLGRRPARRPRPGRAPRPRARSCARPGARRPGRWALSRPLRTSAAVCRRSCRRGCAARRC